MGSSASDVRAGGAFYELWGKDGLSGLLDRLQKRVVAFTSFMQKAGARAAIAGGVLAAPLLGLFAAANSRGADLARLEKQLGVPIEVLNKLQFAADAAGVSLDEVMQDRQGRYDSLIAEAPSIDPAQARAAANSQLAITEATRALQDALVGAGGVLGPYVKMFADFVKQNAGAIRVVAAAAAGLLAFGAVVKGVILLGSGVVAAFAVAGAAVAGVVAAFKLLVSPIGLVVAALAGLGYLFARHTETGRAMTAAVGGAFAKLGQILGDTWGGVVAAIGKGDLQGAFEIAVAAVQALWANLVARLHIAWVEFGTGVVETWHEVTDGTGEILKAMWEVAKEVFAGITAYARDQVEGIKAAWAGIVGAVTAVVDEIKSVWDSLSESVRTAVGVLAATVGGALAPIIAPLVMAADLAREAWDEMSGNVAENLIKVSSWVQKTYVRVTGSITNALAKATSAALSAALTVAGIVDRLDPTDSLKGTIDWLGAARAAVDASITDVGAETARIDAEKQAALENLKAEREKAKDGRAAGRMEDVKAAEDKAAALEKKLAELNIQAKLPAAPNAGGPFKGDDAIKQGLLGAQQVKGGFSGAALGAQLGYADQTQKQTELLKQLKDGNGNLPVRIGAEVGAKVAGVFKVN